MLAAGVAGPGKAWISVTGVSPDHALANVGVGAIVLVLNCFGYAEHYIVLYCIGARPEEVSPTLLYCVVCLQ
jgi:hypothetical protein